MAIYEVTDDRLRELDGTTFGAAGLRERDDLQRLLRDQIEVLDDGLLVVAEEFGEWEDSRRRVDLLAVDRDANLVVIELKRTEDGGHMELQALRYAAMLRTMTFDQLAGYFAAHLARTHQEGDARSLLVEHFGWESEDDGELSAGVRVVLASADFGKELTTTVLWLIERGIDVRCIRLKPYADGGRTLIDVRQVIPLPEASEFQVQLRVKEQQVDKVEAKTDRRQEFLAALLAHAATRTELHRNITAGAGYRYVQTSAGLPKAALSYGMRRDRMLVTLVFDSTDRNGNRRRFDHLRKQREAVEADFGGPLNWERRDGADGGKTGKQCYVTCQVGPPGYPPDTEDRAGLIGQAVDAMIRLDAAVRNRLQP